MITTSKIKNMLVLMCLSLVMILAGDLSSNLASAQQTSAEEQTISIPPQSSTNVLSSSPGSSVRPPASQKWGAPADVPTTVLPQESDPTVWGLIRHGRKGSVSIPNQRAGLLVQSQGEDWRVFRNDSLFKFGGWVLLGIIAA